MTRYVIKLALDSMSHTQLQGFTQSVLSMMSGNTHYTTPNPTLIAMGTLSTAYNSALTAWGTPPSNRGSSVQYAAVLTTRDALEVALTELANYCMTTTVYDKDAFLSGGFQVKRLSTPVGLVGPVRNFRQIFRQLVPSGAVKLKWDLPEGAPKNSVNVYRVMHSLTPDITTATQLALVSKTTYTDLEAANRPSNFYWIIPVCTAGFGGIADVVVGYPQGPIIP